MMADRPRSLLLERSLPDSLPDDGKGLLLERSLPDDGRQAEIKFQRIAKCSLQRGVPHPFMCPLERGTKNSKNVSFAFGVALVMER